MKTVSDTVQIVRDTKGAPVAAVLPWKEYERLCKAQEEDSRLVELATPRRGEEAFPAEVANRLIDGEVPLKVIREWRKLTQAQLAEKAGVATLYISQVENKAGGRQLGRTAAAKLSKALDVSAEVLMDI